MLLANDASPLPVALKRSATRYEGHLRGLFSPQRRASERRARAFRLRVSGHALPDPGFANNIVTQGMVLHTASYQTWVNLAGLPGLTVPVGWNGRGMPVGVQLVAAPGGEQTLLAAGMAVQQALMPQWRGPQLG
jgi:Asp-tRNA(Asn)/Glu-tRNA(Gln) amidotransferase A subunit family amidase